MLNLDSLTAITTPTIPYQRELDNCVELSNKLLYQPVALLPFVVTIFIVLFLVDVTSTPSFQLDLLGAQINGNEIYDPYG